MKHFIETKGLVHEYSRRDIDGNVTGIVRAVDGVDIQIEQGEFVAILGANGSGKSTFAKHLNALLQPTEGTVIMDGKNTSDVENILAIRQLAGMVFQNPDNQIISNVVEEDVGFGPENMGVPTEMIHKRVKESLKSVGMYQYRKKSPNHLSGGQKQRVAIAGIMAMRSKCIILDEATAMLDPIGRENVIRIIKTLNQEEGITVILITHYMEEVVNADKVYVMKSGKVVFGGTPREAFGRPDIMEQARITVPDITKIARGLNEAGIAVGNDILTEEELIERLSQYL